MDKEDGGDVWRHDKFEEFIANERYVQNYSNSFMKKLVIMKTLVSIFTIKRKTH